MSSLEWQSFSATKLVGEQGGGRERERESNSKAVNHKTQVRTAVCFRGLLCSKYLSDCVLQHSFGRLRFKGLSNSRKPNQLFFCPSREHDSDSTFMDFFLCELLFSPVNCQIHFVNMFYVKPHVSPPHKNKAL